MPEIDEVWRRIVALAGASFEQKAGGTFHYSVEGQSLLPDRTNRRIPKSDFARALELVPLSGPGEIHHVQGPSYIYAILMDPRVRRSDW